MTVQAVVLISACLKKVAWVQSPAVKIRQPRVGIALFELPHALPWLRNHAFEVWAEAGRDRNGGFFESLSLDGHPVEGPRRVRVQARQVYCFAQAEELGWNGNWQRPIEHGLDYIARHGRDAQGYLRANIAADGRAIDAPPDLYDQAFYLLALAHAFRVSSDPHLRRTALDLVAHLRRDFSHPLAGFHDTPAHENRLRSNPHMHLLEAALAWIEISDADVWRQLADEIVDLCRSRLIDRKSGALLEYFNADWSPVDVGSLAYVDPGHQFEWSWLLIRYEALTGETLTPLYRDLFAIGQHGVCAQRGVAVDELRRDLSWKQAQARLWPQTERLKAALALAQMSSGADHQMYLGDARAAVAGLGRYLTDVPVGLWRDKLLADGTFVDEPVPASSFYHIVCSILEVSRSDFALDRADPSRFELVAPALR